MNNALLSSNSNEWTTPQSLFNELNHLFNFTLDPAATHSNAKCPKYFTQETDGLKQSWANEVVFCNPPYGRNIHEWVYKAYTEHATTLLLIPARPDTTYWHKYIFNNIKAIIYFIKGRIKFGGATTGAPFPSAIIIFNNQLKPIPKLKLSTTVARVLSLNMTKELQ